MDLVSSREPDAVSVAVAVTVLLGEKLNVCVGVSVSDDVGFLVKNSERVFELVSCAVADSVPDSVFVGISDFVLVGSDPLVDGVTAVSVPE